ncbi:MAG: ABC transporter substrate-binding protein [Firmicutes bacterium]|nr:ABC transporter substrate-binding protein [Bacillota bacterium]
MLKKALMILLVLVLVAPTAMAAEKIVLKVVVPPWWMTTQAGQPGVFQTEILPKFKETHPNVDVKLDLITGDTEGRSKYLLQCRQGTQPDVITLDGFWIAEFAANGYTQPLDDLIPKDLKEDYYAPFFATYNGKIHGIVPETAFNSMLWYRKDLFREAGLDRPPQTWDELKLYARKLTKAGPGGKAERYGLVLPLGKSEHTTVVLLGFYWAGEKSFVDDNNMPVYNNQTSRDLFNLLASMYRHDKSIPSEAINMIYDDAEKFFDMGKAAMMFHGSWLTASIEAHAPDLKGKIGLAPNPIYPRTGKRAVNAGGWGIAITGKDPRKYQAAWDLINMVAGKGEFHVRRMLEMGYFPVQKSLAADSRFAKTEWDKIILSQLPYANTRPTVAIYPEASLEWVQALQEVLMGRKDAEKALEDAVARVVKFGKDAGYIK